jgi:hypothetical protein
VARRKVFVRDETEAMKELAKGRKHAALRN